MPPLELKGNTLGEKHKYYNEQLKMNIERGPSDKLTHISYDECDISNLLKIDIASNEQNVDYILEVLKCEDMLFVSRAVKRSKWLITDDKYSYIVNPSYLHFQLFPHMSSKAISKFGLTIRLHLKNESRVEEFFNYYKDDNITVALKWLPNCSITFIERATQAYCRYISVGLLKRLCEKSKKVIQIYLKEIKLHDKNKEKEAIKFLKKTNLHDYLDIIEVLKVYEFPVFSAKNTKTVMKIAPHRILSNFEKYAFHIHLPTFVKSPSFESNNADSFLLDLYKNCQLHSWFREDNLKPFLLIMPSTKRSNFVKNFLIDRKFDDVNVECTCCARDLKNDYFWYKYVIFETAFEELKKLIHVESSPSERINILKVLLHSAGQDMKNIHFVLKYFRDKHINEPNVFKTSFITAVVEQILTFRLKEETWQILNEIFRSMDVYTESGQNTQFFVNLVLLRRILNDEIIPENIAEKCLFESLDEYRKHLNDHESGKVFDYLYQYKLKKLQEQKISTKSEFKAKENMLFHLLILLSQWGKDIVDFPLVLTEIRALIKINNKNLYNVNLSRLYNINRVWRKSMFADALDLQPSQEVFVNALKHDPNILLTAKSKLQSLYNNSFNSSKNLKQFLYKVRTYWSSSIASDNISFLLDQINQGNDKTLIRHVFILLPKKPLIELLTKYVPEKQAIQWDSNDVDEMLDIQKNIARYLHYARPQLPFEVITWYAKGDYLKFAVPSLTAVLSNMSCNSLRYHIKNLMNTPVSLRKHAIRIASDKLKIDEIVNIFTSAWVNTENKSIRAVLFEHTFKILCKQNNIESVKIIWQLLDRFIDTLTDGENEVIYDRLTKVNRVPLCVRVAFWKKSYKFLSGMSIKVKYVTHKLLTTVTSAMRFMEIVDIDFFAEILDQNKDTIVSESKRYYLPLISRCLLETKSIASQNERYEKVFLPVMKVFLSQWNEKNKNDYINRRTFCELLKYLCSDFIYIVVPKKMVIPAIVFNEIKEYLERNLPADENYVLLTSWKLVSTYLNILSCDTVKTDYEKHEEAKAFENITTNECDNALSIAKFGQQSLQYLIDDMKLYTSSVHISFSCALEFTFTNLDFDYTSKFLFIKSFLNFDVLESYLVALILLPQHISDPFKQEKFEILDILCSHTSPEVKMSCYLYKEQSYL